MGFAPYDTQIHALIVDDYPGVRAGIKNLLEMAEDIVVVGEAANGADAVQLALAQEPHIVLLDIELPDMRGEAVMVRIRRKRPETKVLAVSSYADRQYIQIMLENGAAGYITKEETPAMLLDAIRHIIYEDEIWVSPKAHMFNKPVSLEDQILTKREKDILNELILNRSEQEIADFLEMHEDQVRKYVELLMLKFEATTVDSLKIVARRVLHSSR